MNNLSSKQRKLLYFVVIVVLTAPIIYLGAPSAGEGRSTGGKLAQIRIQEELGESTLGQVDPASSTMNLVLLGMRGIASSMLWSQAQTQQENKDWAGLRATTESIIMLQPHFLAVWEYQGWNLAYNVSAEWDDVRDRYYWVKEGLKFFMRGTERNRKYPELVWRVGNVSGAKVGRSDEWRYFRQYFRKDPDAARYNDGPDPAINPNNLDNYLVSKEWFQRANDLEEQPGIEQHLMQKMLFRTYPSRAQFDYADVLHRENRITEESRIAWDEAYEMWTTKFGREIFESPGGQIILEFTEEDLKMLMERENNKFPLDVKRKWTSSYQDRCQYRYWRTLAAAESLEITRDAHRRINDGKELFWESRYVQSEKDRADGKGPETWGALEHLEDGMRKFEQVLNDFPTLASEDDAIEESLMALVYWREIFKLRKQPIPDDYPLRSMWEKHQDRVPEMELNFRRDIPISNRD